jgi:hypothetical protein
MSGRYGRTGAVAARFSALFTVLTTAACELSEVVIADEDDVVVAEVLVQVRDDRGSGAPRSATALLHRTSGAPEGVPGARIVIRSSRGSITLLEREAPLTRCAWTRPDDYGITCYSNEDVTFVPGEALDVEIDLPGGGRLEGSVRVPGDFGLLGSFGSGVFPPPCRLDPERNFDLRWSRSDGAWAYLAETGLQDFRAGLAARGIQVDEDYLYMLGLASSAADTTIVFPSELGLIERFSLDRDLLVALQGGLPSGTQARVSVAAVERNYTNWARGGTFNPSGQVRIPSLRGDGTGFFGATVVKTMTVIVPPHPSWPGAEQLPACG